MFYGMADNGQLPSILRRVDPRTGSPRPATLLAGSIIHVVALMVPFDRLLAVTNAVALGVFALVDLALWRVQRRVPAEPGIFTVSRWVPPAAALSALALLGAEVLK
jgi:APA family basic amino acid/polyamine antiporter